MEKKNSIRNKRKIKVENYHNKMIDNSKTKKTLSKSLSRRLKFTIVSIFVMILIMISSAYAVFSSIQKSEKYNTLTVGTLKVDFVDNEEGMGNIINLNGAYPEPDEQGLQENPFSFKITNSGTLNAEYKVRIIDDEEMIAEDNCSNNLLDKAKIKVSINGENPFILSTTEANQYIVSTGVLEASQSKNYDIRIWIDNSSGNEVLGKHYHGKIVVETVNTNQSEINNNILEVYKYNSTNCIIGNEAACEKIVHEQSNSYEAGTIIKYNLGNNIIKYFNVIVDNGNTLTLQQTENTLSAIAWNSGDINTSGPITALDSLENAAGEWENVNVQTYEMGVTQFGTGIYRSASTGMTNSGNDINIGSGSNQYKLDTRIANVRMLTIQEAAMLGCKFGIENSCPSWLFSNSGNGYLTMSANNANTSNVWGVFANGSTGYIDTPNNSNYGARAVVVIDK